MRVSSLSYLGMVVIEKEMLFRRFDFVLFVIWDFSEKIKKSMSQSPRNFTSIGDKLWSIRILVIIKAFN